MAKVHFLPGDRVEAFNIIINYMLHTATPGRIRRGIILKITDDRVEGVHDGSITHTVITMFIEPKKLGKEIKREEIGIVYNEYVTFVERLSIEELLTYPHDTIRRLGASKVKLAEFHDTTL